MDRKLCISMELNLLSDMGLPFIEQMLHPEEEPQMIFTLSRSLGPWSLVSASPTKARKEWVGTSVSSRGQGKLYQVTGASGEKHCVQRSSCRNLGVTLSGKVVLYFWKLLGKSKS